MVAKYHEKIRHCRTDYLQKETTKIVKIYDFIAVEDLKVKNMLANPNNKHRLKANHRKIDHQSWHQLRTLLNTNVGGAEKRLPNLIRGIRRKTVLIVKTGPALVK